MLSKLYRILWYFAIITAVTGISLLAVDRIRVGITLMMIGGTGLALFSIWTETQLALAATKPIRQLMVLYGEVAVFIIAVAFSTNVIPSEAATSTRIVVLVLGLQALALTIESHPASINRTARAAILCAGHGAALAGSVLALPFGATNLPGALLLYAVGVPVLLLHAFWIRTYRTTANPMPATSAQRWEGILLTAILVGVPSVLIISLTASGTAPTPNNAITAAAIAVSSVAAVLGFATINPPQTPPRITRLFERHLVAVALHAVVALILVNTVAFAVFLLVPQLFIWILGGLLLLLLVGVGLNYLMIVHHKRSPNHDYDDAEQPSPESPLSAVTVIITGFNEVPVLRETLQRNLAVLGESPFILVPAMRSTDGTIELMQETQEAHPERVRVVEGTTGSKAGDLNRAWQHIKTPYVLVLDADETVGAEFIQRGLAHFEKHPSAGIVQGRKVAASPSSNAFRRFVTIER